MAPVHWEKPEVDISKVTSITRDEISHIALKNIRECQQCPEKPCTYICPSQVYNWTGDSLDIDYDRCVECGACIMGCPGENISWTYPRAGYGIAYKY